MSAEPTTIDDKKREQTTGSATDPEKLKESTVAFAKSVGGTAITLAIYFTLSIVVIYITKIAQANVLPVDPDKAPFFGGAARAVDEIAVNVFASGTKSNKLQFPLTKHNAQSKLLELVAKFKNAGSSSVLFFIGGVIEQFVAFNHSFIAVAYNTLNELLPEPALFLLAPIINTALMCVLLCVNFGYAWVKWVLSLGELFKENVGTADSPKWQTKSLGVGYVISLIMAAVLFFSSWVSLIIPIVFFPVIIVSLIGYNGILDGKTSVAIGDFVKRGFAHYKAYVTTIFSIFLLAAALQTIGGAALGVGACIMLLAYFKKIATTTTKVNGADVVVGFFESFPQLNATALSSYRQATIGGSSGKNGGMHGGGGPVRANKALKNIARLYSKNK